MQGQFPWFGFCVLSFDLPAVKSQNRAPAKGKDTVYQVA